MIIYKYIYPSLFLNSMSRGIGSSFSNTQAIKFDTDNEYVDCGIMTGLNNLAEFSHSFWIKPLSSAADQYFAGSYTSSSQAYYIQYRPANNSVKFHSVTGASSWNVETTGNVVTNNAWNHVLFTYNGAAGGTDNDKVQIWINGVKAILVFAGTIATTTPTLTTAMAIGRIGGLTQYASNMYLDEMSFFTEHINTTGAAEVYNGSIPNDLMSLPTVGQPLHYYRFEDASIATLLDSGTGAQNATTVSMENSDLITDVP